MLWTSDVENTKSKHKGRFYVHIPMKKIQNPDLGLLLIRLALAAVFLVHGIQKLSNLSGTGMFFGKVGIAPFFAYIVAAVETLGGLAMLLGVFTGVAGVLIAIVMACAIYFVKFSKGFSGGWEFDLTLLLAALGVALSGSGKYSLGSYLKRHRS